MNPYKVLRITKDAAQHEIVLAVTRALKRKEYSAREIADAQKILMDPRNRKTAEFIYFLEGHLWFKKIKLPNDADNPEEGLQILHCFDKF